MQLECRLPWRELPEFRPLFWCPKSRHSDGRGAAETHPAAKKRYAPAGSYTNKYGPRLMFRNDSSHMKHAFEPNLESFLVQGKYPDKVGIRIKNHDL